jgi:TrmH family RNA methyltransferase
MQGSSGEQNSRFFREAIEMTPFERITSSSNPRIKAAARLRDAGERRNRGLTLIDGLREIDRAAAAGVRFREVFLDETAAPPHELLARLEAAGGEPLSLTAAAFAKVAFGSRNEGLVAVAEVPSFALQHWQPRSTGPLLVLEGVEKPGNLGAILRTADASGIAGVLVVDGGTDPANPATIRASLGTLFSVPVAVASVDDAIDWLAASGRPVVLAVPSSGTPWHAAPLVRAAIVLGSEAYGISTAWQSAADDGRLVVAAVSLPMLGVADSLNVSATAAVLAYEAVRQAT